MTGGRDTPNGLICPLQGRGLPSGTHPPQAEPPEQITSQGSRAQAYLAQEKQSGGVGVLP